MKNPDQLRNFDAAVLKEVHGIIVPADIRESFLIDAEVLLEGGKSEVLSASVWRISPIGVELLVARGSSYNKGDQIDLSMRVGDQTIKLGGFIAILEADFQPNSDLLGIRLQEGKRFTAEQSDERSSVRWICSRQFYPVAVAENPIQFNDFTYITIRNISSGGFHALTSLRNKYLIPGLILDWQVRLPITGSTIIKTQVKWTDVTQDDGRDYLELGLEFLELGEVQQKLLGQFLMQFSDAGSLQKLRDEGFRPTSLTKGVTYGYIRTKDEFLEVLRLRLEANRVAEKVPDHYTPDDMADRFDSLSRILVGKAQGKIVSAVRLTFIEQHEQFELEEFVELPDALPQKNQVVECGRALTHPEYQRGNLYFSLIQHIVISALLAKRHFALLCTTEELVPFYKSVGCQVAGISYVHPLYPSKKQHLVYIDIPAALSGKNVNPMLWNIVWRDVAKYVDEHALWKDGVLNAKTTAYQAMAPVAQLAYGARSYLRKLIAK